MSDETSVPKGSTDYSALRNLVERYGAREVRNAIDRILIEREVSDPEDERHSNAAYRPGRRRVDRQ